jgi:hypothetical protein
MQHLARRLRDRHASRPVVAPAKTLAYAWRVGPRVSSAAIAPGPRAIEVGQDTQMPALCICVRSPADARPALRLGISLVRHARAMRTLVLSLGAVVDVPHEPSAEPAHCETAPALPRVRYFPRRPIGLPSVSASTQIRTSGAT